MLRLQCAVVSLYSVKQRLKCNTGKVCNCLLHFLLTMVLSIEERVFLVEYVFRQGSSYTDLLQEEFAEKSPETPVPHRSSVRRLLTIRM
jgi:mannose/fructose/N-acetylgalactosamine-specific phosphotransferase system component IID